MGLKCPYKLVTKKDKTCEKMYLNIRYGFNDLLAALLSTAIVLGEYFVKPELNLVLKNCCATGRLDLQTNRFEKKG